MASKFQHRLVGTMIVIAIGVIVLPTVLDGKKQHYQEKFAAIPLVPKQEITVPPQELPPATEPLPEIIPPEQLPVEPTEVASSTTSPPVTSPPVATTQNTSPIATVEPTKPLKETQVVTQQPPATVGTNSSKTTTATPVEASNPNKNKPPVGNAYIIQLGALSNASRVNELVAQLTLANYRVYTVPRTPVQGQLTRIFVGPEISKQKLETALPALKQLTGLQGIVKSYNATQ